MQVHDLAQRLTPAGHDVVVVTPTAGPSDVDGVRVRRLDVPLLPFNIPFTPKSFRMTADVLQREQVDVAHFHGGIASPLSYAAAYRTQKAGLPTVITTHCMWSYVTPIFGALDRLGHWSRWDARVLGRQRRRRRADRAHRRTRAGGAGAAQRHRPGRLGRRARRPRSPRRAHRLRHAPGAAQAPAAPAADDQRAAHSACRRRSACALDIVGRGPGAALARALPGAARPRRRRLARRAAHPGRDPGAVRPVRHLRRPGQPRIVRHRRPRGPLRRRARRRQGAHGDPRVRRARPGGPARRLRRTTWSTSCSAWSATRSCGC